MRYRRPSLARASRRRLAALLAIGIASALALGEIACRSLRPVHVEPVPTEASRFLDEAEAIDALGALGPVGEKSSAARESARSLARQALAAEPNWIAPQRLLDDLMRAELRGVEALQAHRDRLAFTGEDARELYLAGRLEGADGEARFSRAAELDPTLAWARHGLAVGAERRGDLRMAIAHARAAFARARDPWERSFFASSLARFLARLGRREDAIEVIAGRLAAPDITARDRLSLSVQSVGIAVDDRDSPENVAAYRRGLELLRDPNLLDDDVETLSGKLRSVVGRNEGGLLELSNALAVKRSPVRDQLRAEIMLGTTPTPLALGLLERSLADAGRLQPSGPLLRAARFAAGDFAPAVERWLVDLPSRVIGPDGLPKDECLARVVRCSRAVAGMSLPDVSPPDTSPPEASLRDTSPPEASLRDTSLRGTTAKAWFDFGDALLAAGWFREARALAGPLARGDFDRALALEGRAAAGIQLLDSLDDLIRGAGSRPARRFAAARADRDSAESSEAPAVPPRGPAAEQRDLTGLLSAMGPLFARAGASAGAGADGPAGEHAGGVLGAGRDAAALSRELSASPRLDYGLAGQVVHPGPTFTKADERDGLGKEGDPVPGLAREMEAIHRFALLGELSGAGGPDGTVLSRLMTEDKRGEHLGVPWSGSVVWCEGADVRSRAERAGARISAAALHEGYWMDIDSVRGERSLFAALRTQFSGPDAAARVDEALAVTGFSLESSVGQSPGGEASGDEASGEKDRRRRERTRTGSALGEASRVRLSILRDRKSQRDPAARRDPADEAGEPGPVLGEVTLDELALVTGTHEEGHLTDRTRFLPISKHWAAALGFLVESGFSPTRVAERLEYRAELVALVDSPDPRVPLAQVLDAAEAGGRGPTAHAAGYEDLLEDLLRVFDDVLAHEPNRFPRIDPARTLVHQLHRLGPEEVRALARKLAEKQKLVR